VNALVQDPPYVVNQDYDAVAFCTERVAENRYKVTIPLAELSARQNTGKGEQGIDVLFVQPNGNRYRWRTVFDWSQLKPGDSIPMNPAENFWGGY